MKLSMRVRTALVDWSSSALNWNSYHLCPDLDSDVEWRWKLYWFVEGLLSRLFQWAFPGSHQEIEFAVDFAAWGFPDSVFTPLQLEIKSRISEWADVQPTVEGDE